MPNTPDKFCDTCGFKNCAHESGTLPETSVAAVMANKEIDNIYDMHVDCSMDHKSKLLRMQSINFAMMHYFGQEDNAKSLLCYNWLQIRGKVEPLTSLGDYLAYRNQYNFEDLE